MKRKVLISVLILALTLSLCLGLLVACNPDEQTTGSYTVTFSLGEYEGADPPAAMQADSNGKIVLPSAAQWPGHDFLGWQADGSSEYLQPGTEYTVPKNITLVAKWTESASTPQTYTVTLKDGDDVDTFKVSEGNSLGTNLPATGKSQDERKQFKGWYLADEQGAATSQQITSEYEPADDVTLIAVYDEVWFVTLHDEGKTDDEVLKVVKGQAIGSQLPAAGAITDDAHKEFVGWYIGGGVNKIEGTYTPTQDITLTARYNTYYLVTVKIDGQAEAAPRKVLVAEPKNSLQLQASEELDHRIFKGWYIEGEDTAFSTSATASYTPNGDVTLEARYNDLYTLTFKDCDEEGGQKKDRIVKLESGVALGTGLPTATFDPNRFEFVGWYVADADGAPTEAQVTADFTTEADVTIVAKFNNKYAIEFYDGGSLVKTLYFVSGTVLDESAKAQFPNTTPAADKQFDGWYLMDGDDQTDNPFDATQAITADVKVYAKYSNNYWLLTFVDGNSQTEVKVTKGQTLGTQLPQDPTPEEGKYFNGWFVANDQGTASETKVDNTFKPDKDLKIVADYKDMYKVTLKGATVEYVYVKPGDALPELTPKASEADEGKVFEGWYIMKGAEPAGDDDKIEKANEYKPTGNVTIYAKFVEPAVENYTVHFKNGENVTDVEVPTNAAIGEKLPEAPADTDETYFAGWFLANDASYVATDTQITSSYKPTDGVKEVYAVAVFKNFLKVTLKDGQSSKIVKVKQGASVPAAELNPATPEDYSFDGWFVSEDGENPTETKFDDKTVVEQDMTVIAKYTLAVWYVTFKGECIKDGDSDGTQKVLKVQKGTKLGTLPEIEESKLDHKRFDKWVIENTDTTVTTEYEPAGDITVVAKYIDTVTITFVYGPNNMPITIDKGVAIGAEKLAAPEDYNPEHVGAFLGWYRDGGEGAKVEATDTFDEDTTLTAKYAYLLADEYLGEWNCEIYTEDGTIMYMLRIFAEGETWEDHNEGDSIYLIWIENRLEYEKWDDFDANGFYSSWDIAKIEAAINGGYNLLSPSGAISATIKLENGVITYKSNDGISNLDLTLTKVKDEYEITFDDDGRTESLTVTNGQAIGESFPAPQGKEGYDFVGWFIKDTNISVGMNYIPISDLTIVAKYDERKPVSSIASQYQGAYYVGNHPYKGKSADLFLVVNSDSIMLAIQESQAYGVKINTQTGKYEFIEVMEYIFVRTSDDKISSSSVDGYTFESYSIRLNQGKLQLIDSVGTVADMESRYYIVQWLDEDDSNRFFSTISEDNHVLSGGFLGKEVDVPQRYGKVYSSSNLVQNGEVTNYKAATNSTFTKTDDAFDDAIYTVDGNLIVYKMVWKELGDKVDSIDTSYVGEWENKASSYDRKIEIAANGNIVFTDNIKGTTLHASISDIWPYRNGLFHDTYRNAADNIGYIVAFHADGEESRVFYYVIQINNGVFKTIVTDDSNATTATYEKVIPLVESIDDSYIGNYSNLTRDAKAQTIQSVAVTAEGVTITIDGTSYSFTIADEQIRGDKAMYTLGNKDWTISLDGGTLTIVDLKKVALQESVQLAKLDSGKSYITVTYKDGDSLLGYSLIESGQSALLDEVQNDTLGKIADGWALVKADAENVKVTEDTIFVLDGATDGQLQVESEITLSKQYIDLGSAVSALDESYKGNWSYESEQLEIDINMSVVYRASTTQTALLSRIFAADDGYVLTFDNRAPYTYYTLKLAEGSLTFAKYDGSDSKTFSKAADPATEIDASYDGVYYLYESSTRHFVVVEAAEGYIIVVDDMTETQYRIDGKAIFGDTENGYRFDDLSIVKSGSDMSVTRDEAGAKTYASMDSQDRSYIMVRYYDKNNNVVAYSAANKGNRLATSSTDASAPITNPPAAEIGDIFDAWYVTADSDEQANAKVVWSTAPGSSAFAYEGKILNLVAKYVSVGEPVSTIPAEYRGTWTYASSTTTFEAVIDANTITLTRTPKTVTSYSPIKIWTVYEGHIYKTESGYTFAASYKTGNDEKGFDGYIDMSMAGDSLKMSNRGDLTLSTSEINVTFSEHVSPEVIIDETYLGNWASGTSTILVVDESYILYATHSPSYNSSKGGYDFATTTVKVELDGISGDASEGYTFDKYLIKLKDGKMVVSEVEGSSNITLNKIAWVLQYQLDDGSVYAYGTIATENDYMVYKNNIATTPLDSDNWPTISSGRIFLHWSYIDDSGKLVTDYVCEASKTTFTIGNDATTNKRKVGSHFVIIKEVCQQLGEHITSLDSKLIGTWTGKTTSYNFTATFSADPENVFILERATSSGSKTKYFANFEDIYKDAEQDIYYIYLTSGTKPAGYIKLTMQEDGSIKVEAVGTSTIANNCTLTQTNTKDPYVSDGGDDGGDVVAPDKSEIAGEYEGDEYASIKLRADGTADVVISFSEMDLNATWDVTVKDGKIIVTITTEEAGMSGDWEYDAKTQTLSKDGKTFTLA